VVGRPCAPTSGRAIPRYVHLVNEFPMTVTGKVRKVEMRERALALLGLTS
jgi:fatty-acyl-CoA synthase